MFCSCIKIFSLPFLFSFSFNGYVFAAEPKLHTQNICNTAELFSSETPGKRSRLAELSLTQQIAVHFINLMQKNYSRGPYKTSVHKLMYFANGLHWALHNRPMFENYSFIAHQHGALVEDVQEHYSELEMCSDQIDRVHPSQKLVCDFVFETLGKYPPNILEGFTHEIDTPWFRVRMDKDFRYDDMHIPIQFDQEYFSNPNIVRRFFWKPFFEGLVTTSNANEIVLSLLKKYPHFLISQLQEVEDVCAMKNVTRLRELITYLPQVEPNFQDLIDIFISQNQGIFEGALAEKIFDFGFIDQNEIRYFFEEFFRNRAAIASHLKSLPALYYLKRIFDTFSEREGDYASQCSQQVNTKLEDLADTIISRPIVTEPSWQILYDHSLAYFYKNNFEQSKTFIDQALKLLPLPNKYRRDLLKRAFYLTDDERYADDGIRWGFHEFYMQKAITAPSLDMAFPFLEKGIDVQIPIAFFEAGKSIVQQGYRVLATSGLWQKMNVTYQNNTGEDCQIILGKTLLKQAIELGVTEALTFYTEHCSLSIAEALEACALGGNESWALYQKAKVYESNFLLNEALIAYKEAGPLLGYSDAARLASPAEMTKFLAHRSSYKKQMLEELFNDFVGAN